MKRIIIYITAIIIAYFIVFFAVRNAVDESVSVAMTRYMDEHTLQVNCD